MLKNFLIILFFKRLRDKLRVLNSTEGSPLVSFGKHLLKFGKEIFKAIICLSAKKTQKTKLIF